MILSVHQPNFIPWIGYFHKIACSDIFILLDQVQYPRGKSVANRNKIKTINGVVELVVPISKPKGNEGKINYNELKFAEKRWSQKILKTIQFSYSKSPFFDEIFDWLSSIFLIEDFCEMNIYFIKDLSTKLGLTTKIIMQSELAIDELLKNNDLIIEICKITHSNVYLSGSGASVYNAPSLYQQNNITLTYVDFEHPKYPQINGEFESHLSIIDALFNLGFKGTRELIFNIR